MSIAMLCAALRAKCTQIDSERKTAQLNTEILQDTRYAKGIADQLSRARHEDRKREMEYYKHWNKFCDKKHMSAKERKKFIKPFHLDKKRRAAERAYEHQVKILHRRDAILTMCMEMWRAIGASCATIFENDDKIVGEELKNEFGNVYANS